MKTEAEVGVTLLQAKKLLEPTEARERQGQSLPWILWREGVPASTLKFKKTVKMEHILVAARD